MRDQSLNRAVAGLSRFRPPQDRQQIAARVRYALVVTPRFLRIEQQMRGFAEERGDLVEATSIRLPHLRCHLLQELEW